MSLFESTKEVIQQRRSIFPTQLDGSKTIPRSDVEAVLDSANYAPSHYRTEPWRFMVFTGKSLNAFFEAQVEIYKSTTPESEFSEMKIKKMQMKANNLSHLIVVIVHYNQEDKLPQKEEEWAVACVVQNMHLICTALNIGAYWGTGKLAYSNEMHQHLSLADNEAVMGLFQMGVPKDDLNLLDKKPLSDLSQKTTWK